MGVWYVYSSCKSLSPFPSAAKENKTIKKNPQTNEQTQTFCKT